MRECGIIKHKAAGFNSFKRYEYVSRTSLGEMTGEIYINEALKLIESSPAASK